VPNLPQTGNEHAAVILANSFEEVLEKATKKLKLNWAAKRLFTATGVELSDFGEFSWGMQLNASMGEPFKKLTGSNFKKGTRTLTSPQRPNSRTVIRQTVASPQMVAAAVLGKDMTGGLHGGHHGGDESREKASVSPTAPTQIKTVTKLMGKRIGSPKSSLKSTKKLSIKTGRGSLSQSPDMD